MHTNSSIIPSTHALCRTAERAGQRCHGFPSHILHQPCKGEPGDREPQESSHAAPSPSQHSRRCSSKSSTIIQYCGSRHWYTPPLTPQEQPTAERHQKKWAWGTVKGSHVLLNSGQNQNVYWSCCYIPHHNPSRAFYLGRAAVCTPLHLRRAVLPSPSGLSYINF